MPGRVPERSDFQSKLTLSISPPPHGQPPTNVLILLHGLGDTHESFARLGQQLSLPETACISLRAPHPLPFDLGGFHWGDDMLFDQAGGDMDMDAGFEKAARMIGEDVIKGVLIQKCGYRMRDTMVFGFGQGGMAALASAVYVANTSPAPTSATSATRDNTTNTIEANLSSFELGGVISVGGPLPSTTPRPREPKLTTPVLLAGGRSDTSINMSAIDRTKAVFENVEVTSWRRSGDAMPRNRDEMLPIMQFFSSRLKSRTGHRSLPKDGSLFTRDPFKDFDGIHNSSISITERPERSFFVAALHLFIRPLGPHLIKGKKALPVGSPQLKAPDAVIRKCFVRERHVQGIYVYDITARQPAVPWPKKASVGVQKRRILYFAGGGWQMPATPTHWKLCAAFTHDIPSTTVTLVSYPLAPNSPAPDTFPRLMELYHALLSESTRAGETVTLAGDSAGANPVLCMTLHALSDEAHRGTPPPSSLLLLSPSTDLTRSNPAIQSTAPKDPILNVPFIRHSAKTWCGSWDPADPRVSPLNADISLLRKHNVKERLAREGVKGSWLVWEKQMHAFPLLWVYGFRESKQAKKWVIDVLKKDA